MPGKRTITSKIQTEANLRHLSNTFLSFSGDPESNIRKLVNSLGEMLGAVSCMYNKPHLEDLVMIAGWNTPNNLPGRFPARGRVCSEIIRGHHEGIILVPEFDRSKYAAADPGIREAGIRTFMGKAVELGEKPIGAICALFDKDFTPGTEDEEIIGIIASAIAVQESLLQKIADIRDREHKLQTLIDNSPNVAIQFYDANGKVKYWNKASEDFYGFTGEETRGRSLAELILDKEGYESFVKTLEQIDTSGETITSEWTVTAKTGVPHHIMSTLFSIQPLHGQNGGKDFICMDVDLTDLKNAEIKLKQYTADLENLNATKDKFFSIIAHDLKNPFNAILGFSRILYNDYKELKEEEIMKFIRAIRDLTENTFKLLENLLVWSRIQTGHAVFSPELCTLSLLVNETLALLKPQAVSKNISVTSGVDPAVQVYGDENMVKTILRNLLSNAIKYTPAGGMVEIVASELPDQVRIEVKDTGIGMSEGLLSRLFTAGESTERPGTANEMGTGLGLILCREFLHKHDTDLMVVSEEGKGSTFSFLLRKTGHFS